MQQWTTADIPNQHGRIAVVTGTGGIGLEVARALARAGAYVILAGRNTAKGMAAVQDIHQTDPAAKVEFRALDLAQLASVRLFSRQMRDAYPRLDLLVNNAGVMTPPTRRQTDDGFELQLGTNHLGHFALTAELLPLLRKASARVITLSSIAARQGAINFSDLQSEERYQPMQAYSQSKLACLMFALELQRRSDAGGWGVVSVPSHPGISRTDLLLNGAGPSSAAGLMRRFMWFLFQPVAQGALPALFAATSSTVRPGMYIGPDRWMELRGHPTEVAIPRQALDLEAASRLWTISERLTGAGYPSVAGSNHKAEVVADGSHHFSETQQLV